MSATSHSHLIGEILNNIKGLTNRGEVLKHLLRSGAAKRKAMEHGHSSKVEDDMRYSLSKFQAHYIQEILHTETICQGCFGDPKKVGHAIGQALFIGRRHVELPGNTVVGGTLFPRLRQMLSEEAFLEHVKEHGQEYGQEFVLGSLEEVLDAMDVEIPKDVAMIYAQVRAFSRDESNVPFWSQCGFDPEQMELMLARHPVWSRAVFQTPEFESAIEMMSSCWRERAERQSRMLEMMQREADVEVAVKVDMIDTKLTEVQTSMRNLSKQITSLQEEQRRGAQPITGLNDVYAQRAARDFPGASSSSPVAARPPLPSAPSASPPRSDAGAEEAAPDGAGDAAPDGAGDAAPAAVAAEARAPSHGTAPPLWKREGRSPVYKSPSEVWHAYNDGSHGMQPAWKVRTSVSFPFAVTSCVFTICPPPRLQRLSTRSYSASCTHADVSYWSGTVKPLVYTVFKRVDAGEQLADVLKEMDDSYREVTEEIARNQRRSRPALGKWAGQLARATEMKDFKVRKME